MATLWPTPRSILPEAVGATQRRMDVPIDTRRLAQVPVTTWNFRRLPPTEGKNFLIGPGIPTARQSAK